MGNLNRTNVYSLINWCDGELMVRKKVLLLWIVNTTQRSPFVSPSDLWFWPGTDSRPRARPHRLLDRVRGYSLVQGSGNHAQLKGRCVFVYSRYRISISVCWLLNRLCLRATLSPSTSGQWAASWLRCCPTSPSSPGNTIWTSSTTYWVSLLSALLNVNNTSSRIESVPHSSSVQVSLALHLKMIWIALSTWKRATICSPCLRNPESPGKSFSTREIRKVVTHHIVHL